MRRVTRVTVLGGGQLGRMLGLAGIPLGCSFRFLDPAPDASAAAVGELVVGQLDDVESAAKASAGAAVVTYEWEGVPAETVRAISRDVDVFPPASALDVSQDRLTEKEMFRSLGIGTAPFAAVDTRSSLDAAVASIGLPAVLKTRRGGYDGKGQAVLRVVSDVDPAWQELGGVPLLLEGFVAFARELSIVAARSAEGGFAAWPVVENEHVEGVLRVTRAPAPGSTPALQAQAEACIRPLFESLQYVGVGCVELFDIDGELLANEMAPRVHNSGHWTIEGAETSQFENHLRAVLGWPLGSTAPRGVSAMVNCIGSMPARERVLDVPGAHWHDYDKAPRPGRKVGHVTVTAADATTLADPLAQLRRLIDLAPS